MGKLIVHIGYPKTATTTLQRRLFSELYKKGIINYLGKHYDDNKLNSEAIIQKILYGKNSPKLKEEIRRMKSVLINNKLTILSNEDLSMSFIDHIDETFIKYVSPFETANNIKEFFSVFFDDIEIIITIRAQKTMLYSFYVEIYKWKYRHIPELNTFNKFLYDGLLKKENGNFLMFYYYKIFKFYNKIFGKDKVHIFLYEDLLYRKQYFFENLADILKIKKDIISDYLSKKENVKKKTKRNNYITDSIDLSTEIRYFSKKILKDNKIKLIKSIIYDRNVILKYIYKNIILKFGKNIIIKPGIEIPYPSQEDIEKILKEFKKDNSMFIKEGVFEEAKMKEYGYI